MKHLTLLDTSKWVELIEVTQANGHLKDSRSGVLLLGQYSRKWLSGMSEELCQEHSALLPLKREEGKNTVKKNMSFSKWGRGGGQGIMWPSAVGLFSFHTPNAHLREAKIVSLLRQLPSMSLLSCRVEKKKISVEKMQMRFLFGGWLFRPVLCYFPGSMADLSIVVWFDMEQWALLFLAKSSRVKCYVIQINRAPAAVYKGQYQSGEQLGQRVWPSG